MQASSGITLIAQGLAAALSGHVAKIIGRRNALCVYTFIGAIMFTLAGLSKDWGSMYYYWAMRGAMGFFAGSQPVTKVNYSSLSTKYGNPETMNNTGRK